MSTILHIRCIYRFKALNYPRNSVKHIKALKQDLRSFFKDITYDKKRKHANRSINHTTNKFACQIHPLLISPSNSVKHIKALKRDLRSFLKNVTNNKKYKHTNRPISHNKFVCQVHVRKTVSQKVIV